jgi:hypothetical protein
MNTHPIAQFSLLLSLLGAPALAAPSPEGAHLTGGRLDPAMLAGATLMRGLAALDALDTAGALAARDQLDRLPDSVLEAMPPTERIDDLDRLGTPFDVSGLRVLFGNLPDGPSPATYVFFRSTHPGDRRALLSLAQSWAGRGPLVGVVVEPSAGEYGYLADLSAQAGPLLHLASLSPAEFAALELGTRFTAILIEDGHVRWSGPPAQAMRLPAP